MDAKICVTCHERRPLTDFNRRASAADGRQARCRACCRAWYENNREQHLTAVRARRPRARAQYRRQILEHFLAHPCVDCGEGDVRVLEFDHREGESKVAEVSVLVRLLVPWPRIEAEIAKCDVRCANCHRIKTAERGGGWRYTAMVEMVAERIAQECREALRR